MSWLLGVALVAGPAVAAETPASAPTRERVTHEIEALRADPDFAGTVKQKTLRFKDTPHEKKPAPTPGTPLDWLRGFARWMTEAGRLLVWAAAAVGVALFLVGLRHWVRVRAGAVKGPGAPRPSHVQDLDIRPESLPARIGEAAAALWQRGEQRAALSLLYRGALSRLVHQHAVPIRAASTEGECLALAARRLAPERSAYFGRLVQAWQVAVYGARPPDDASVTALCRDFDAQFAGPALQHAAAAP
ncbi:MAG: DUF4129 domain-containing protein [Rhizobacter sp.]|nr:DUF4129 domain-containing protein [Rhizobacter sp.]